MDRRRAGTGYLTLPESGAGPGVLVLHAWWGLTPFVKEVCDRLAAAGFVALAPDLYGGRTASEVDAAERLLAEADADALAHVTRSSLATLRAIEPTTDGPVGIVGFSMGASLGLWLSARVPEAVAATAVFYGTQDIDFEPARSAYLGHFAEHDPYVDDDALVLLEADLRLLDKDVAFHRYPGTSHWFVEEDRPEYDDAAATLAWERTVRFLHEHLAARAG
jgi:carboxymethylenebutenolidase